jgi:uncharacterized membrane protein YbhN (UPF0104 family)
VPERPSGPDGVSALLRVIERAPSAADTYRVRLQEGLGRVLANRRLVVLVCAGAALVVAALTARFFLQSGWPLRRADMELVAGAGALCLLAHWARAVGWRLLFGSRERPRMLALAAAGGAAQVTSLALPGKLDAVVRVAVVRRFPGAKAGIGAVCLSLVLLGMVEAAALTPIAGVAALHSPGWLRAGLIVVAVAGAGSLAVVLALPRLGGLGRISGFRLVAWLRTHTSCPRETIAAFGCVSASWLLRGAALFLLLHALGLRATIPLALVLLCASAAASAIPVAPAGAATQAGAGAAVLAASGVGTSSAVAFGLASQVVLVLAGAALVLAAAAAHGLLRLVAPSAP